MTRIGLLAGVVALVAAAPTAHAFCGFYVSGSGAKLSNDATQVVLLRQGTRTVLSMQNDYKGPLEDFAMVVPVPVVLRESEVKTLDKGVFERIDSLGSPRLVEYWEQDPCPSPYDGDEDDKAMPRKKGMAAPSAGGGMRESKEQSVKIEARFDVAEYKILILSATDSSGSRSG